MRRGRDRRGEGKRRGEGTGEGRRGRRGRGKGERRRGREGLSKNPIRYPGKKKNEARKVHE